MRVKYNACTFAIYCSCAFSLLKIRDKLKLKAIVQYKGKPSKQLCSQNYPTKEYHNVRVYEVAYNMHTCATLRQLLEVV